MGLLSGIGSALGGIGSVIGAGTGLWAAGNNYSQQQSNLAYTKEMQERAWEREDTAHQRAVADLKAAGLSPVLAAGSASPTSSPVKTEAPQLNQSIGDQISQAAAAPLNTLTNLLSVESQINTIKQQEATIAKTSKERDWIAAQIQRNDILNAFTQGQIENLPLHGQLLKVQAQKGEQSIYNMRQALENAILDAAAKSHNLNLSRQSGLRTTDTNNPWSFIGAGSRSAADLFNNLADNVSFSLPSTNSVTNLASDVVGKVAREALRSRSFFHWPFARKGNRGR